MTTQMAKSVEEVLREQIKAVLASMAAEQPAKREEAVRSIQALANRGDKRARKASERLSRIHALAKWAIEHGAEDELFKK